MPLELRLMTKEDAHEAVALMVASYKDNPFRAIVLPTGMSQVSIDHLVKQCQKAVDDPEKYALKVVDTENSDAMAGCAVWEYTKARSDVDWDRKREEGADAFPEARLDIRNEFVAKEHVIQRRIMGHTRWLELYSLNTLPAYQRRGVGSMLVKWGTDRLEVMKVAGFVIATDQGHGLYVKHGFKEVERWETDMSRWPPGQGIYKNSFLTKMPSDGVASPL